jgi:hypothetical protein
MPEATSVEGRAGGIFATVVVTLTPAALGAISKLGLVAEGLEATAQGVAPAVEKSFFEGTQYTQKVLTQMQGGVGEFHSFPESVTAFESAGSVRTITGGDGVVRQMLEIPGSYGARSRRGVHEGRSRQERASTAPSGGRIFPPASRHFSSNSNRQRTDGHVWGICRGKKRRAGGAATVRAISALE